MYNPICSTVVQRELKIVIEMPGLYSLYLCPLFSRCETNKESFKMIHKQRTHVAHGFFILRTLWHKLLPL